jgi:hypothetical protein
MRNDDLIEHELFPFSSALAVSRMGRRLTSPLSRRGHQSLPARDAATYQGLSVCAIRGPEERSDDIFASLRRVTDQRIGCSIWLLSN